MNVILLLGSFFILKKVNLMVVDVFNSLFSIVILIFEGFLKLFCFMVIVYVVEV